MLFTNATVATLERDDSFGLIPEACIAVEGARIVWVGPVAEVPESYRGDARQDLGGRLVTPALIDCRRLRLLAILSGGVAGFPAAPFSSMVPDPAPRNQRPIFPLQT